MKKHFIIVALLLLTFGCGNDCREKLDVCTQSKRSLEAEITAKNREIDTLKTRLDEAEQLLSKYSIKIPSKSKGTNSKSIFGKLYGD